MTSQNDEQRPLLAGNDGPTTTEESNTEAGSPTFSRQLNAFNGFALLISVIIGSGIFASPAAVDTNVPSPGAALLIWLVGGLLAWTGSATMAELGTAFPGEGGIQFYLRYIYGDLFWFLAAWAWVTAVMPATLSILSIVFVESLHSAFSPGGTADGVGYKFLSILVLVIMGLANSIGTKASQKLGSFFLVVKLGSVVLLVLAGLVVAIIFAVDRKKDYGGGDWHKRSWFQPRPSVTPEGTIDWTQVGTWEAFGHYATALYAALWGYASWDKANYVAAELKNPKKQLPLAINTALPTVIVSYVLINAVYYVLLPWSEVGITDAIAVVAIKNLLGKATGIAFAILVCLVIAGALNGNIFVAGRLTVAAARNKYIPSLFSTVGSLRPQPQKSAEQDREQDSAPFNALILSAILTSLYILLGNFRALLTFDGMAEYTFFFLTVVGDIILRFREPDLARPYKPPIILPILFCIVSGFVVIRGAVFAPVQFAVLVGELVVGIVWYYGFNLWRKRREEREGSVSSARVVDGS
ncbi:amino acid transporter [Venturia nashicola]|uniref:Amino acid transporter n=1 Tax=Venturia nashicola TaxID=86259 RepID=A0A4Z1NJK4_9PEZI|nr:amino acid transporter [Venturia nashicola]